MITRNTAKVLDLIVAERERQKDLKAAGKFPWTCADEFNPDTGEAILDAERFAVLAEEFGEVARVIAEQVAGKATSTRHLKEELIQVAAVAVAWAESL